LAKTTKMPFAKEVLAYGRGVTEFPNQSNNGNKSKFHSEIPFILFAPLNLVPQEATLLSYINIQADLFFVLATLFVSSLVHLCVNESTSAGPTLFSTINTLVYFFFVLAALFVSLCLRLFFSVLMNFGAAGSTLLSTC
jgi:hypothetical protein